MFRKEILFGPGIGYSQTFRTPAEALEKANNYALTDLIRVACGSDKGSKIFSMTNPVYVRGGQSGPNTFNKFDPNNRPLVVTKKVVLVAKGGFTMGLAAYVNLDI